MSDAAPGGGARSDPARVEPTRADPTRADPTRALFEEYARTRDLRLRDQLVAANLRLALHLARRFAHRGVPLDDLEQVASLGLLKAIDRFDPGRGLEFSTFATPTITGELKRHFRDKGWAVRVPRRVQELHIRLNTLVAELTHRLGRSPTIAELAAAARASEEEVLEAMEAALAYRSDSLDEAADSPEGSGSLLGDDDQRLFDAENRLVVEGLLVQLPPREQLLLRLRFFEEMTQAQIAERLGISQMHVSRLISRCLEDLRSRLEAERRRTGT
jgi:RNA polymerase sigma-B factor